MMLYSKSENAFYQKYYNTSIPKDVVEIEDEYHAFLLNEQCNGKVIVSAEDGFPITSEPPQPTEEQLILSNEIKKNSLVSKAKEKMFIPQTKLLLGNATSTDKLFLINYIKYTEELEAVDLKNPLWPEAPES